MRELRLALGIVALLLAGSCRLEVEVEKRPEVGDDGRAPDAGHFVLSDAEWRRRLTPEQYFVLREGGDEIAYTGAYWAHSEAGTYHCAGCGQILFDSSAKLQTDTGLPSFRAPVDPRRLQIEPQGDGVRPARVRCSRCRGHLGYLVRDDGPSTQPLYRINSAGLRFVSADEEKQ